MHAQGTIFVILKQNADTLFRDICSKGLFFTQKSGHQIALELQDCSTITKQYFSQFPPKVQRGNVISYYDKYFEAKTSEVATGGVL